jgi:hypothetical protein
MFRPQYIPDFFVAEHYGLRNTTGTFWWSKDLALGEKKVLLVNQHNNSCQWYFITATQIRKKADIMPAKDKKKQGKGEYILLIRSHPCFRVNLKTEITQIWSTAERLSIIINRSMRSN